MAQLEARGAHARRPSHGALLSHAGLVVREEDFDAYTALAETWSGLADEEGPYHHVLGHPQLVSIRHARCVRVGYARRVNAAAAARSAKTLPAPPAGAVFHRSHARVTFMLPTFGMTLARATLLNSWPGADMLTFMEELREQRWDDHRYYHHNRINQSLHLLSSSTFVLVYVLLFVSPVVGVLLGWIFAMWIRQVGHFFFEPKDYDVHNQATHEEKESIKVGYNLHRKIILLSVFSAIPLALWFRPQLFAWLPFYDASLDYVTNLASLWLVLGVGAVLFRGMHLFFLRGFQTGLVWMTKIVTDPFHDIMLYHRAPMQVLRGEMYDPRGPHRAKNIAERLAV